MAGGEFDTEKQLLDILNHEREASLCDILEQVNSTVTIDDVFLACLSLQRDGRIVRTKPATYALTDRERAALETVRQNQSTDQTNFDQTKPT